MITVRFPTGFSVQYNMANFVEGPDSAGVIRLWTKKAGDVIARVPSDCIIEFAAPCRTYNPVATDSDQVIAAVDLLAKEIRSLKRRIGKGVRS